MKRIADHRTAVAPAALGSVWPLVVGIAIAWLLQRNAIEAYLGTPACR